MLINMLATDSRVITSEIKMDTLFSNQSIGGLITICLLCSILLFANILRRKIPFLRRSFMPTAVIAGLIGLAIKEIILATTGFNIFDTITLNLLIYHSLPIAFIALCLRDKDDYAYEENKGNVKKERVPAVKSGSIIISTYLIQGIVGVAVCCLCVFFIDGFSGASGLMMPLGFGQGPQQANATGRIWDESGYFSTFGSGSAQNFGITVAAMGFLWASIPGIILVNRIAKKRGIKLEKNEYQTSGHIKSHTVESPDEIPLSESIDKFSLQVCMIGGVYLVTICLLLAFEAIFTATGVKFLIDLIPTLWGFSFMLAAVLGLLTKLVLKKLIKKGVMHRKYPNSYMMNRIGGLAFDLSIAAALFLISVADLGILWVPILIMSSFGGLTTIFYCRWLCNRTYKDYKDEAFLAMYGMLTGTLANGMILLREIDKDFTTPAADDLVIGSSSAIVLGLPLLLLIAQAPAEGRLWWTMIILILYFGILTVYQLGLFKKLFKRKGITIAAHSTGSEMPDNENVEVNSNKQATSDLQEKE